MITRRRRMPRPAKREPTLRRLMAAAQHNRREQARYALFADQVAEEQEDPAKRIDRIDEDGYRFQKSMRDLAARHWRRGRAFLRSVEPELQAEILSHWNEHRCPASAEYFVTVVRSELTKRGRRVDG